MLQSLAYVVAEKYISYGHNSTDTDKHARRAKNVEKKKKSLKETTI